LDQHPIFYVGVCLTLMPILMTILCIKDIFCHGNDDTGTSGGLDGIFMYCGYPPSLTYLGGGLLCIFVPYNFWSLITVIFNFASAALHCGTAYWFSGVWWHEGREEDPSEATKRYHESGWTRLLPEALGIGLSLTAGVLAIYEIAT